MSTSEITLHPVSGAINLPDDFPVRPTTAQVDALMRKLSGVLGRPLGALRVSGFWIIGENPAGTWKPVYGHELGQQTRKFTNALAGATGRVVVATVGF